MVCANIRPGGRFAVAEAYQDWYDVSETEVALALKNSPSAASNKKNLP
jgi:predicted phosphoribosyltransferase